MAVEVSEDQLMEASRTDREAFARLVSRTEQRLFAFVVCVVTDAQVARDLTQDTFLKLWESRHRYRPEGRFFEYLFTIARNECRAHGRRAFFRRLLPFEEAHEPVTWRCPEALALQLERTQALRTALAALPESYRVPLTLRFVDGADYAQIARIIGRTESAARSRIHYGLKQLASLLPEEHAHALPVT